MTDRKSAVLIELEEESDTPSPAEAPPVFDDTSEQPATGYAMTTAAVIAARPPSFLARWFWRLLLVLLTTVLSITAWNFATDLVSSRPILGWIVSGLIIAFILVCVMIAIKELAAFSRLSRIDALHRAAESARADGDLKAARKVTGDLTNLYKGREDTQWGRERLSERREDVFDASGLLDLAERELLSPLDGAARQEVEAAARQVATVTALVPLALADVAAALTANLRMIRRIAEIYGGRSGTLGSWRLTRAVMSHLVATGALAVGDDMLEPILGGGVLGKLSRRFGEGLVNGGLTARVGVAAIEPVAIPEKGNTVPSRLAKWIYHRKKATAPEGKGHLRDMIFGAIDGSVTTFAIVAGVAGAGLSPFVIVALGLANVAADGFSMAVGNYSGTKAELDNARRLRAKEKQRITNDPKGSRDALRRVLGAQGLSGKTLEDAVDQVSCDHDRWITAILE
ncbi:unnamed protein product, partial [Cyprideis torosa]